MTTTPTPAPDRTPAPETPIPETTADLRALGRRLDHQVTTGTAATPAELDATLTAMHALHTRITATAPHHGPNLLGRSSP
ncbi:hypothetical protein OG455_09035 [Kitasatospora sp. NBC_01287]|uniref:hypothetical protein n=1 Tax=Kitasatospora sp. NBC_01287 TaxID=2903573 RepID=UPI00225B3968|nr:hypothetical protein [Kitasatospora sp. NBC_01287]MCX4745664.1 hypothetical protein [Kitasatospora sp. NBC_01287]